MARLILENIYKKYDAMSDYAVHDMNLECDSEAFVAILGPSGCGKTTTLRMIAGLESITSGRIIINGKVMNDVHPKHRGIGLAFEDYALYPPLNVYNNIAFNLKARKTPEKEIHKAVSEIADLLHITEILESFPRELSGGQKQRVNIARAIIRRPSVLLLDEPMSHLDGKLRQTLRHEIRKLHREIGCTTILVTHDQLEAMSLADTCAIMDGGHLQQFASPYTVYNTPFNEFVAGFIGDPPMNIVDATVNISESKQVFSFYNIEIAIPTTHLSLLKDGQHVRLGIRPDDIMITRYGAPVKISVFENLGEERRISIKLKEDCYFMISILENTMYKADDEIKIACKENKIHLFNSNGETL